jgi:Xaa-Pro aminopeptidase
MSDTTQRIYRVEAVRLAQAALNCATRRYTHDMRVIFGILLTFAPLFADGIPRDEYRGRRAELRKSLDGVMVLFGAIEPEDLHSGFFQDTNFLYLSGWREPKAAMLLTKDQEILFLPERNRTQENFTGRKLDAADPDAPQRTGFDKVMPTHTMDTAFLRALDSGPLVYKMPNDEQAKKLAVFAPFHREASADRPIYNLRMIKSPAEIALIERSTEATIAAHLAAWKRMKSGLFEYQIAATMTDAYLERGCERSAYAPIVGSGPNSTVLHYMANRRRMDAGEVVVMDVGAECSDYATDVTRTVPASGKFTARQREIYEIVLGAQKAAIAAIKPGIKIRGDKDSLRQIAMDYINSHGKDLHGEPLGKYFTHGLSHHVGLDVHDASDVDAPLRAGMVITIEPGIYIPEENIGVRIEDTVLVTENGSRNLSGALPREVADIERLVGK